IAALDLAAQAGHAHAAIGKRDLRRDVETERRRRGDRVGGWDALWCLRLVLPWLLDGAAELVRRLGLGHQAIEAERRPSPGDPAGALLLPPALEQFPVPLGHRGKVLASAAGRMRKGDIRPVWAQNRLAAIFFDGLLNRHTALFFDSRDYFRWRDYFPRDGGKRIVVIGGEGHAAPLHGVCIDQPQGALTGVLGRTHLSPATTAGQGISRTGAAVIPLRARERWSEFGKSKFGRSGYWSRRSPLPPDPSR